MRRITLVFLTLLMAACASYTSVPVGKMIYIGNNLDEESLKAMFLKYNRPVIIINNAAYIPDDVCYKLGSRSLGGDEENRSLGGDTEDRSLGGDEENRSLGGDEENRSLGGDEESRSLGGDEESRSLGGDEESRSLGGDEENRSLGGDSESRSMGSDQSSVGCSPMECCPGIKIIGISSDALISYYNGETVIPVVDNIIIFE